MKKLTLQEAKSILRPWNISLNKVEDEFRVNFSHGHESTAYYTPDLVDAVATGQRMYEDKETLRCVKQTKSQQSR